MQYGEAGLEEVKGFGGAKRSQLQVVVDPRPEMKRKTNSGRGHRQPTTLMNVGARYGCLDCIPFPVPQRRSLCDRCAVPYQAKSSRRVEGRGQEPFLPARTPETLQTGGNIARQRLGPGFRIFEGREPLDLPCYNYNAKARLSLEDASPRSPDEICIGNGEGVLTKTADRINI